MNTKLNDSKRTTFLEIINDDEEISEITMNNKILTQRFKNANTVNRTRDGYMFHYEAFDKSYSMSVELIHAPIDRTRVKSRKDEDFSVWSYRIFGETNAN